MSHRDQHCDQYGDYSDLIDRAVQVLRPYRTPDNRLFGDVGAALLSDEGNVYVGVCVDTPSWGLCAERSALAAMVTAGEYRFRSVVAVWRDKAGRVYVVPPCGVCREFMRNLDKANLDAQIILGREESKPLRELIPCHEWPSPLVDSEPSTQPHGTSIVSEAAMRTEGDRAAENNQ